MSVTSIIIYAVVFVIDIAVGIWYAKEGYPETTMKAFWLKMLASGIFVATGVVFYLGSAKSKYDFLIIIALVLGIIGDALLSFEPFIRQGENRKRNILIVFFIGAGVFFGGHIVYIAAFVSEIKLLHAFDIKYFFIFWAAIIACTLVVKTALRVKFGKFAVPISVYSLGLSAMGALSFTLAIFGFKGNIAEQLLLFIAPSLFIISDSSLGLKFTDKERFGSLNIRYVTLITYYAAQMLFALTIAAK